MERSDRERCDHVIMIEHVMWTSCEWQTMRRRHSSITSHVLSALGKASVGLWVLLCWINTTQHELRDSSHDFFWIVAKQIQTKQVLLYKCLSRPRPRSGQNSTRRGTGITSSFKVRASGKPAWVQADIALEIVPLKRNFDFSFILHSRHNMNFLKDNTFPHLWQWQSALPAVRRSFRDRSAVWRVFQCFSLRMRTIRRLLQSLHWPNLHHEFLKWVRNSSGAPEFGIRCFGFSKDMKVSWKELGNIGMVSPL